jgi:putative nucleotidyltransferase with HDIG domain
MNMAASARELVDEVDGLVTLPDVYLRISRLLDDPDCNTAALAEAIGQDPSFTLRLLKVANSSLYRFPSAVDTVAKAVAILGTAQVRNLALSMSVAKSFDGLPNDMVSMANFWRHSLYCALIARHLARAAGRCDPDALFTAGLLHDIGELVIFSRRPEQAKQVLYRVLDSGDEMPVFEAERETLGFDHAAVGGELARRWHLPPLLEECIAHHHELAGAARHAREAALVHVANGLALIAETGVPEAADEAPIDARAWEITGLGADCIEPAVAAARTEIGEAEALFAGTP